MKQLHRGYRPSRARAQSGRPGQKGGRAVILSLWTWTCLLLLGLLRMASWIGNALRRAKSVAPRRRPAKPAPLSKLRPMASWPWMVSSSWLVGAVAIPSPPAHLRSCLPIHLPSVRSGFSQLILKDSNESAAAPRRCLPVCYGQGEGTGVRVAHPRLACKRMCFLLYLFALYCLHNHGRVAWEVVPLDDARTQGF